MLKILYSKFNEIKNTTKEELSKMMVGRDVKFTVDKEDRIPGKVILNVEHLTVPSKVHKNNVKRQGLAEN